MAQGTTVSSNLGSSEGIHHVLSNVPCLSSVYIGAWVRINSSGFAVNAMADTTDNAHVIGVVENKASTTLCTIRFFGITKEIFSSLDVTKTYFLSTTVAGAMQSTVPGSGTVLIRLGKPFSATRFSPNIGEKVIRV